MGSWTLEHNEYLSCLLDNVTGTEKMVRIRKDYCKIHDSVRSCISKCSIYYSGSRAEGLDLPSSDDDYMEDINDRCDIDVAESIKALFQSTRANKFQMITDNVSPGFAFLKCYSQISDKHLLHSLVKMGDSVYLSSHKPYISII